MSNPCDRLARVRFFGTGGRSHEPTSGVTSQLLLDSGTQVSCRVYLLDANPDNRFRFDQWEDAWIRLVVGYYEDAFLAQGSIRLYEGSRLVGEGQFI